MIMNPSFQQLFQKNLRRVFVLLFVAGLFLQLALVSGVPDGAQIIFNTTETRNATPATSISTAGGSFTTLLLNGTTQTPRWKAYVGNASGILTLDDSSGKSIYDWSLLTIAGEVYASRSSSITWSTINCSNASILSQEESVLNVTTTNADSINRTFNNSIHRRFFVGGTSITNSTCPAIATYVNDTRQATSESALFQEVLLSDGASMVYSTILEPGRQGFDAGKYNFQLIVPENEYATTPTPYYFFLELS